MIAAVCAFVLLSLKPLLEARSDLIKDMPNKSYGSHKKLMTVAIFGGWFTAFNFLGLLCLAKVLKSLRKLDQLAVLGRRIAAGVGANSILRRPLLSLLAIVTFNSVISSLWCSKFDHGKWYDDVPVNLMQALNQRSYISKLKDGDHLDEIGILKNCWRGLKSDISFG